MCIIRFYIIIVLHIVMFIIIPFFYTYIHTYVVSLYQKWWLPCSSNIFYTFIICYWINCLAIIKTAGWWPRTRMVLTWGGGDGERVQVVLCLKYSNAILIPHLPEPPCTQFFVYIIWHAFGQKGFNDCVLQATLMCNVHGAYYKHIYIYMCVCGDKWNANRPA